MMEHSTRALRRHHYRRLQKTRQHYWGRDRDQQHTPPLTPRELGYVANTPHPCSCYLCGNPRRNFNEKTVQERRILEVTHGNTS